MTAQDDRIAALERQVEQLLQRDAEPSASPRSVLPNGWPGPVAAGELVESAWGNAVSSKMQETNTKVDYNWQQMVDGDVATNTRIDAQGIRNNFMSVASNDGNFTIQGATSIHTTGPYGTLTFNFPQAFPSTPVLVAMNGDSDIAPGGFVVNLDQPLTATTANLFLSSDSDGLPIVNTTVRIEWIAISPGR